MKDNSSTDSDESLVDRLTPSRRIVIKSAAAMGLIGGLGSTVTSQEYAQTFELGGERSGWEGIAPSQIEGETNPTLQVVPGNQYQVAWENLDGAPHNFAIVNEDGDIVASSEYASSQGEVVQFEFAAEESFAQYVCEPHADTMRGDIELIEAEGEGETEADAEQQDGDDEQDDDGQDDDEQQDAQQEDQPTEDPATVFSLALEDDEWVGTSPEEIEGESNPTLDLEAGEVYSIVWTLRTERERHETGHNLVIYDEDLNHLAYTEFLTNGGASRTLKFTADEAMTSYSDQSQLDVSGEIDVSGSGDGDGGDGDGESDDDGNGGADGGNESDDGNETNSGNDTDGGNETDGGDD